MKEQETLEKYKQKMKEAINNGDTLLGHVECDKVLCEFLVEIGYKEIVDIYDGQEKHYYD